MTGQEGVLHGERARAGLELLLQELRCVRRIQPCLHTSMSSVRLSSFQGQYPCKSPTVSGSGQALLLFELQPDPTEAPPPQKAGHPVESFLHKLGTLMVAETLASRCCSPIT